MRTTTNTLVVNLCVADFLSSVFEAAYWSSQMGGGRLHSHKIFCRVILAFEDLFQVASFLAMCGIAFDRYFVLVKSWKSKITRTKVRFTVACTWVLSTMAATPVELIQRTDTNRCLGFPHFYDPRTNSSAANILLKTFCILLPIWITYYVFFRIIIAVRQRGRVGVKNNYIQRNWSAEKFAVDAHSRSSKTAVVLFSMYLICTFPFSLAYLLNMAATGRVLRNINVAFIIYLVLSLRKPLFPAIYIFRNRAIQDNLRIGFLSKMRPTDSGQNPQDTSGGPTTKSENSKDSWFSFGFVNNFWYSLWKPRVHPEVYDGENKHFPNNLDAYFSCNIREHRIQANGFTNIIEGVASTLGQEQNATSYV